MGSDASIYSQVKPAPSFADRMQQMLTLRELMDQSRYRGLQMQQTQQGLDEAQAVRQAFQAAQGDPGKVRELLAKSGKVGPQMLNVITALDQHMAALDDEKLKHAQLQFSNDAARSKQVSDDAMKVIVAPEEQKAGIWQALQTKHPDWPAYDQLMQSGPQARDTFLATAANAEELNKYALNAAEEARKTATGKREQTNFDQQQAAQKAGTPMGPEWTGPNNQRMGLFRVLGPDGNYTTEQRAIGEEGPAPKAPEPGKDIPFPKEVQQQRIDTATAEATAKLGPQDPRLANVEVTARKDVQDKVQKAQDEFTAAQQAANDMKTFIDQARSGNKIAYAYAPTEGVLTLNTARGVKRVNMAEISSYSGAGSAVDKIKGFFGKQASGASIPADVLNDMETIHAAIVQNAATARDSKLSSIDNTYRSTFSQSNPAAATPPKKGEVRQGYIFLGGDPASPKSWKKQ